MLTAEQEDLLELIRACWESNPEMKLSRLLADAERTLPGPHTATDAELFEALDACYPAEEEQT